MLWHVRSYSSVLNGECRTSFCAGFTSCTPGLCLDVKAMNLTEARRLPAPKRPVATRLPHCLHVTLCLLGLVRKATGMWSRRRGCTRLAMKGGALASRIKGILAGCFSVDAVLIREHTSWAAGFGDVLKQSDPVSLQSWSC